MHARFVYADGWVEYRAIQEWLPELKIVEIPKAPNPFQDLETALDGELPRCTVRSFRRVEYCQPDLWDLHLFYQYEEQVGG